MQCQSNLKWRFHKYLRLSLNTWTLSLQICPKFIRALSQLRKEWCRLLEMLFTIAAPLAHSETAMKLNPANFYRASAKTCSESASEVTGFVLLKLCYLYRLDGWKWRLCSGRFQGVNLPGSGSFKSGTCPRWEEPNTGKKSSVFCRPILRRHSLWMALQIWPIYQKTGKMGWIGSNV